MAKVTIETLDHIARLAQLSLSNAERELFAGQLQELLAYAESIQALDTKDVPPMSHARTSERLRDDVETASLPRDQALSAAPDGADRLFRVPRMMGG